MKAEGLQSTQHPETIRCGGTQCFLMKSSLCLNYFDRENVVKLPIKKQKTALREFESREKITNSNVLAEMC